MAGDKGDMWQSGKDNKSTAGDRGKQVDWWRQERDESKGQMEEKGSEGGEQEGKEWRDKGSRLGQRRLGRKGA